MPFPLMTARWSPGKGLGTGQELGSTQDASEDELMELARALRQREGDDVIAHLGSPEAAAAGGDHHELLACSLSRYVMGVA
jgi:hypothetical protein